MVKLCRQVVTMYFQQAGSRVSGEVMAFWTSFLVEILLFDDDPDDWGLNWTAARRTWEYVPLLVSLIWRALLRADGQSSRQRTDVELARSFLQSSLQGVHHRRGLEVHSPVWTTFKELGTSVNLCKSALIPCGRRMVVTNRVELSRLPWPS